MTNLEVVHRTGFGYDVKVQLEEYNFTTEEWEAADISGFNIGDITMIFRKPTGGIVEVGPSFVTDGSDGWLVYTVLQGDSIFTERGSYEVDINLKAGGQNFYSTKYRFPVDNPLTEVT